ncbi:hypothetical protein BAnh1_09670 [Bartonella australis AUST/NH1]|uniref:Prophage minor tail protein Z (GPZ) n=1 Tax=Bartonella australis (strain Aust/NH1) TaxID=1094489 RepID=M1N4L3_BARAA|nr:hypothetical protein [Bartonella australis]AGF74839.1 hypothetical protein BAnh1_09670 [Bartonella australis AUST/NH1]
MTLIIRQKWYLQQVEKSFSNLQAPRLNWALRNAINSSAKQVERFAEKQVTELTSAKSKRVKQGIYIKAKATAKFLETEIIGSGTALPLKFFKAKETKRGVVYTLFGKRQILPHGFIRGGRFPKRVDLNMGGNVFEKAKGDKFPIAKQEGPAIAKVMSGQEVTGSIEKYAHERLTKNIQIQLARQEYAAKKKA